MDKWSLDPRDGRNGRVMLSESPVVRSRAGHDCYLCTGFDRDEIHAIRVDCSIVFAVCSP